MRHHGRYNRGVSTTNQDARFARAWQVLRQAIAERAFPAAAVAITHGGELVALRGFGRFTYQSEAFEVKAGTIFDLASVSKVVATTAMAMILYERGQLDLDIPVAAVVPEFGKHEITFRMLLDHSSGLPAYEKLFQQAHTREELLKAAFETPLAYEPGERTEYSDIGFIVLGEALERMAGERIDSFCQREVFGPLGMTRTCYRVPRELRGQVPPTEQDTWFRHRVIQGEVQDENAWVMGGVSGHAGVFAPAEDVARFALCMLRGGAPILRANTVELFITPSNGSRALGWDTPSQPSSSGQYFSSRSFGHLGYAGTSLWCDPERELSVTLLTNRTWPDRSSQLIKQVRPAFHDTIVECLG